MKFLNFGLALAIAGAFEIISYSIYLGGLFAPLGLGVNVFLSFALIPLGVFIVSWSALSLRKEKPVAKVSELTEFAELKRRVSSLESKHADLVNALITKKLIVMNPITESGFRAKYGEYLSPEQKPQKPVLEANAA